MNTLAQNNIVDEKGSFRDSVATINQKGQRNYIHPKKPKGKLYNRRTLFSLFYLIVFFTLPFLKYNGEPLLMINVLDRKFIIFGLIFWPQDFFIFGIAMITFIVFVIVFTVAFGRLFCGWACPQTVFMEMVFRKIEYLIDGDAAKQRQLKAMPWNGEKIRKRVFKFIVFYALSFLIANFFLAYLISMDVLIDYIKHPKERVGTLVALSVFTTVFFFVYWWFREQACIVVCPYGRLQGVLLDKNSIIVAYDHKRGEPRGKANLKRKTNDHTDEDGCGCGDGCTGDGSCKDLGAQKTAVAQVGDCIDCAACVRVCPTGIDIRNGTQLECVNCTACIDACDEIMVGVNKPVGLIRYASENSIRDGVRLTLTGRLKAYITLLVLLISVLTTLILTRTDLDIRLMHTSGMTYTSLPDGRIANLYNLKLVNKTHLDVPFEVKLENTTGEISLVGSSLQTVKKESYSNLQFFVKLGRNEIKSWKTKIQLGIYSNGKKLKTIKTAFIGPEVYN